MNHNYKRWYDHDPVLLEVINLLQNYQQELKSQAEICNRWYDKDPIISRTVELLRVVPPDVQKATAQSFLKALSDMGIYNKEESIN